MSDWFTHLPGSIADFLTTFPGGALGVLAVACVASWLLVVRPRARRAAVRRSVAAVEARLAGARFPAPGPRRPVEREGRSGVRQGD